MVIKIVTYCFKMSPNLVTLQLGSIQLGTYIVTIKSLLTKNYLVNLFRLLISDKNIFSVFCDDFLREAMLSRLK